MPKVKTKKNNRHQPLGNQLADDEAPKFRNQPRQKERASRRHNGDSDEEEEVVPAHISKKILAAVREQQVEIEQESESKRVTKEDRIVVEGQGKWAGKARSQGGAHKAGTVSSDDEESDDDMEEEEVEDDLVQFKGDDVEIVEIDGADEAALERFMFPERFERRNLAELIMDRIREKEEEAEPVEDLTAQEQIERQFDPKIIEVYRQVGTILSRYSSGKLPKAFKIIPSLRNWEEVLYLTEPDNWSPVAYFVATRLFASNLNVKMAQRFYNLILLPRVRDDIQTHKKLNYHLYMALKKALYKPQAWYKGILIPLVEEGNCTLREAAIIGSVIAKVSVPAIHSAAALMKISEMRYSGATSIFMRILLNKKYSLPRRVISAVAQHFASFITEERDLPVLWHHALLTFAQRYKHEISEDLKEKLKEVMRKHMHYQITPEIRRELFGAAKMNDDVAAAPVEDMEL